MPNIVEHWTRFSHILSECSTNETEECVHWGGVGVLEAAVATPFCVDSGL